LLGTAFLLACNVDIITICGIAGQNRRAKGRRGIGAGLANISKIWLVFSSLDDDFP
jgi:hypothetical protein